MARPVTPSDFEQFAYDSRIRGGRFETVRDAMEENLALRAQLGEQFDRETEMNNLERRIIEEGRNDRGNRVLNQLADDNYDLDEELAFRQKQERIMKKRQEKAEMVKAANALVQIKNNNQRNAPVLSQVMRDTRQRVGTPTTEQKRMRYT